MVEYMSARRQREWLERSSSWKIHEEDGDTWRPIRVLGQGGYGICGLWEITKEDSSKDYAVVKQVAHPVAYRSTLKSESTMLYMCHKSMETDHVVKLLKSYHSARGTGTHPLMDPGDKDKAVGRMYLEYCEEGDMHDYLDNLEKATEKGYQISEESIWRIWQCLIKAIAILERGSEERIEPGWNPIVHFDIKPANILITKKSKDPNLHKHTPVFKLADFGLAIQVPKKLLVSWNRPGSIIGTPGYYTPEQEYYERDKADISLPANVFGIARCIYTLLAPGEEVLIDKSIMVYLNGPDAEGFKGYGSDLLGDFKPLYSKTLIGLVLTCLAHDPKVRPTATDLLPTIQTAIDFYEEDRKKTGKEFDPQFNQPFEEPKFGNFDVDKSAILHTEPRPRKGPSPRLPKGKGYGLKARVHSAASGRSFEPMSLTDKMEE